MPAWLAAALALLRSITFGTPTRALVTGATTAIASPFASIGGFFGLGDGDDKPRRRRRRRALTQSDRNDIAFIAATIGKAAAGSFAVQLATRSR